MSFFNADKISILASAVSGWQEQNQAEEISKKKYDLLLIWMTRPFNPLVNRGNVPVQSVLALIKLLVMPDLLKLAQIGENVKEIIIASRCPECGASVDQHAALPKRLAATFLRRPPACSSVHIAERRCSFSFRISLTLPVFSARGGRWEEELEWNYFGGCCTRSEIFTPDTHKAWASVKLWVADINKNGKPPAGFQCLDWTALHRDLLGIADESHRRWHDDPQRQWIKE